ncbi:ABC transporter permease [Eubacterium barkeri]|uniref:ABC-type proline/glycine betaine transport system, permease component n=1 Tax=Eubacterium barkeri TaxID=1528 RepID=A0A1H3CQM7_EUBBA|nr:ABC transporter permease [Eubacterium barkeri]SDX55729.1 ABC-type proline/glycine betaine transport system, permease component [Eubacterium barkeri]
MLAQVLALYEQRAGFFGELLIQHLAISGIAILIGGIIGLIIGIVISGRRRVAPIVIGTTNVIYTIPSIALLGFLIPITGIGNTTAIVALSLYALMPMVRNTYTGLTGIDGAVVEAARGMGSTKSQIMVKIRLPLAMPVIWAGFRNMVVMTIALTGIASFIGAGGLGVAIYRGITTNNLALTVAGGIIIAALAFTLDYVLGFIGKKIIETRRLGV